MSNNLIKETFVDGIRSITFVGGVIRADLARYSSTEKDENGNPLLETTERLIISPQGFLQTSNVINDLMKKMMEAGVIQKREAEEGTTIEGSKAGDKDNKKKK